jgi:hypothetical protein
MSTLVLDSTTKTIKVNMSGAAATTNPDYIVSYADNNGTTFTEGALDGALNGVTDVTVVSAPASSTRRIIKSIYIENKDTAAVTITIKYDNNATQRTLAKVTLNVGDTWSSDGTYDTNGALKQTLGTVNLASVTGTLPIANGGTGATTLAGASITTYTGTETLTNKTLTNPTVTNYTETLFTANTSTAITVALTNGTVQQLTLTGNATITMPTATAGKSFIIMLKQDATGGRSVTWTTVKYPGGTAPTITATASKQDIFSFFADGTNWYGTLIGLNYTP